MSLICSQDLVMSYLFATIKNAVPIVINLTKLWTKSDSKSLPLAYVETITSIRINKHTHSPYSTLAQSKLLLWGSRQLRVPAPPSWITVSTTVWPFSSRDFRIYKKKQIHTVDGKRGFFGVSNCNSWCKSWFFCCVKPLGCIYIWEFNPPLFARLSLPQKKIRRKHSEGVIWEQKMPNLNSAP